MDKNLRQAFHYFFWTQPSSIHQCCPCSTQGPPSPAHHPQPPLWHNAVVAFRAFMLAVVWGRLKTHCVRQPLSWVAGRNLLGCEWRDRNAHMNGLMCAGHLLIEGRYASVSLVHQLSCSITRAAVVQYCRGDLNEWGASSIVLVVNNYHQTSCFVPLFYCTPVLFSWMKLKCKSIKKTIKVPTTQILALVQHWIIIININVQVAFKCFN